MADIFLIFFIGLFAFSFVRSIIVMNKLNKSRKEMDLLFTEMESHLNKWNEAECYYKRLKFNDFDTDQLTITLKFDEIDPMWTFLENHENLGAVKIIKRH